MILCEANTIINYATLITAIASLLTGFYVWYDRRPKILISVEIIDHVYFLVFENIGKSVARNIKFSIDKEYIDSLPEYSYQRGGRIKEILFNIQSRKFIYAPGVKKRYYLMQAPKSKVVDKFDEMCNEWYINNQYKPLRVSVEYNGWFENTEEFFIDQFNSQALLYRDPLDKIVESINSLKTEQKKFNSLLEILLKNLDTSNHGQTTNEKR